MYIHTHTHTHKHTYTHTNKHTQTNTHKQTHTQTHIYCVNLILFYFFPMVLQPNAVTASLFFMRFLDHTQRRTTVGRTTLDE